MHLSILGLWVDILVTVSRVYHVVFSSVWLLFPSFVSPVSNFP